MQMLVYKLIKEEIKGIKHDYGSINLRILKADSWFSFQELSSVLHAYFDGLMSIFGARSKNESCLSMSLACLKISASLDQ